MILGCVAIKLVTDWSGMVLGVDNGKTHLGVGGTTQWSSIQERMKWRGRLLLCCCSLPSACHGPFLLCNALLFPALESANHVLGAR